MRALLVFLTALCGCRAIVDVDDKYYLGTSSSGGGGAGGDATCPEGLVTCDPQSPCAVDLETNADHCGRCGRDCGGGSCQDGRCPVLTLAQYAGLWTYDIAHQGDYVYWTAGGWDGDPEPYSINLVAKYGGGLVKVFKSGDPSYWHPAGVVVRGDEVYWTTLFTGGIYRAKLNGLSPATDVVQLGVTTQPTSLADDDSSLYTTSYMKPNEGGGVARISKSGAGAFTMVPGQSEPNGVAVDDAFVYWVVTSGAGRGVWRADKVTGGDATLIAPMTEQATGFTIDPTSVFWFDRTGQNLMRANKDGTSAQPIAPETDGVAAGGVAVDDDRIYWFASGRVMSAAKDGTGLRALAIDQLPPGDAGVLTVDDTQVYWIAAQQVRATVK